MSKSTTIEHNISFDEEGFKKGRIEFDLGEDKWVAFRIDGPIRPEIRRLAEEISALTKEFDLTFKEAWRVATHEATVD